MTDELKLCPFCGGEPTEHAIEPHSHAMTFGDFKMPDHEGSHVIECVCGAGLIDDTRKAVVARWNTRALTQRPAAQEVGEREGWTDADADAARLALELECLLLDTKDTASVSRWWASANEALDLHRARLAAAQAKEGGA